jgi:hypothetical protein
MNAQHPVPPARKLADFEGHWSLTRDIVHENGPPAFFEGEAHWTPQGDGLAYLEAGMLTVQGLAPIQGERRYVWGPDLTVYFEDGRVFHHVPPRGGPVSHWCDPDQYDGRYDFSHWPSFEVEWQVNGPRKAYRMTSTYRRV